MTPATPFGRKSSSDLITASSRPAKLSIARMKLCSAVCISTPYSGVRSISQPSMVASGRIGSTSPRTTMVARPPTSCTCPAVIGRISRTIDRGTASGWSPTLTSSTGRIARVRGRLITNVVPLPRVERISMVPLSFWMLVRTTSMPTPRPETSDTWLAMEKPGRNTRLKLWRSSMVLASSSVMRPFSSALARSRSAFMPRPSSAIRMTI